MDRSNGTICALASGHPPSAIAVIRLSGPAVQDIARQSLSKGLPPVRRAILDRLTNQTGQTIDEPLVVFMPGPRSYTGEDILEVSLHGGRAVISRALDHFISLGARLAEPGEFTRRAFESGKLDLTQAEAVADLIDAETEVQHKLALQQLDGALSEVYQNWRGDLTEILAFLEANIDFPDEEDAPETVILPVLARLTDLLASLEEALSQGNLTERLREGFRIAILGAPNAGKSTLLNRFAGREAAIVTDIAGTTRDIIEVRLTIGPYLVWLADTAGLRETVDPIEAEGVRRAHQVAESADLRLWLLDGSDPDIQMPNAVRPEDLILVNKSDLGPMQNAVSRETLSLSAKTGEGFDTLFEAVSDRLSTLGDYGAAPLLTRVRHRAAIERALTYLRSAKRGLENGVGSELAAEDIRIAAYELASLTGAVEVEEILGAVFSTFCIGK